ncbi:MAG: hypothetical protein IJO75_01295 [Clostridia bacterium]|nr:hypothetical protein [Clostridia bacterium]
MYEKEMANVPMCETESNAEFVFPAFQEKKRALAEECMTMSEKILNILVGSVPQEMKQDAHVKCFMDDLASERNTLNKLYDNLCVVLRFLGA